MRYMNYMLPRFLTLTLFMALGCKPMLADDSQAVRVDKIVSVLHSLANLAQKRTPGQNMTNPEVQKEVEKLIPDLDPDQLGRLAILSLTLFSGDAGNVGYDEVYYTGFWVCVDRLFKKGDKDSFLALLFVQSHAGLDGGEREMFDESMDKLQKKYAKDFSR